MKLSYHLRIAAGADTEPTLPLEDTLLTPDYAGFRFDTGAITVRSLNFRPSGSRLYIYVRIPVNLLRIFQYDLTTSFSVESVSYQGAFETGGGDYGDFAISGSGSTAIYVNNASRITSAALGTPWDITSVSSTSEITLPSQPDFSSGCAFNDNGTKVFVYSHNPASEPSAVPQIFQWTLSSPYDISSAGARTGSSVLTELTERSSIAFNSDGTRLLFIAGIVYTYVYELSTPWDITTMSYIDAFPLTGTPVDLTVLGCVALGNNDNTLLVGKGGNTGGDVYEYNL